MKTVLFGILVALVALLIMLFIGNLIVLLMLQDIPWLRLLRVRGQVRGLKNIAYVRGSRHHKHRLDLYLPKKAKNFPVVHFVHGGYWRSGDKDYYHFATGLYENVGIALAEQGIGAVIQNYRLHPEVTIDEQISDVLTAVRWTTENIGAYGGNENAIYLMGHSAGGHLTSLIGTDEKLLVTGNVDAKRIKGYIALSAVFNLKLMALAHDARFNEEITYPLFGRDERVWERYSPSAHFREGLKPFLVLIGEKDLEYLMPQADAAVQQLTTLHDKPEYYVIPGYSHMDMVVRFGRKNDEILEHVLRFVKK